MKELFYPLIWLAIVSLFYITRTPSDFSKSCAEIVNDKVGWVMIGVAIMFFIGCCCYGYYYA